MLDKLEIWKVEYKNKYFKKFKDDLWIETENGQTINEYKKIDENDNMLTLSHINKDNYFIKLEPNYCFKTKSLNGQSYLLFRGNWIDYDESKFLILLIL